MKTFHSLPPHPQIKIKKRGEKGKKGNGLGREKKKENCHKRLGSLIFTLTMVPLITPNKNLPGKKKKRGK